MKRAGDQASRAGQGAEAPTLGGWLRSRMRERRLRRSDLARLSGVSYSTLWRITGQNVVPKVRILYVLADFFGADRNTVLEIAGVVQPTDLSGELPVELRDLVRRLNRLGPQDRRAVLAQFDGILKLADHRFT